MHDTVTSPPKTFIQVSEVWVPDGDNLVFGSADYGSLDGFAATSRRASFAKGEGLPGKAWAEGRPVVLKEFDGSYFKRAEAAKAAGLTSGVAIPVFNDHTLKAVLVVLFGGDADHMGAIEVWQDKDDALSLDAGYYGAAKDFEWVSQHTSFAHGQGLPGGVWAAQTPILMRDLGSGYAFIRSESAGKAGLSTGLGLPVPTPADQSYVLTLLSAKNTPIARRFEIWDAKATTVGATRKAILTDGICAINGPLWSDLNPPVDAATASVWQGPIGQVLGSGLPFIQSGSAGLPEGYSSMVALPIYRNSEMTHVVAWYL